MVARVSSDARRTPRRPTEEKTRKTPDSVLIACLVFALLAGQVYAEAPATKPRTAPATAGSAILFEEVGERAGARIEHHTRSFGDRPKAQVLEMFTEGGSAAAVGDVNNDGMDDIFVVDSGEGRPHHLLLNQGVRDGVPNFVDVARKAGVQGGNTAYAICADAIFFDFDNDDDLDLLVARFGTPLVYENQGGTIPKFQEVSQALGLDRFANTITVVAFDANQDGFLDLLLGNYFSPRNLLRLETPKVLPNNLDYADNGGGVSFYLNVEGPEGQRRFVDRTAWAGFDHHTGWTLDVGHGDLDNDGDQDVYLAGDYGTDRLFLNRGDGTFEDVTEKSLGWDTKKGMNVDMGDFDRNGYLDIYVTNITDEYMKECNMLWQNFGDGTFVDVSKETGTCDTDWGWAAKFADFDNDGWLDILATNGLRSGNDQNYIPLLLETTIIAPDVDFSDLNAYPDIGEMTWSGYQKQRLFRNQGDGSFREVAAAARIDNELDGRGLAVGDFDRDGRLDVFQTSSNQPSLLYMNRSPGVVRDVGPRSARWIGFDLRASQNNRRAIGARVTIRAGAETWIREVDGGNGYASASTHRLHFGLGQIESIDSVEIRWPSGRVEKRSWPLQLDRYHQWVESEVSTSEPESKQTKQQGSEHGSR